MGADCFLNERNRSSIEGDMVKNGYVAVWRVGSVAVANNSAACGALVCGWELQWQWLGVAAWQCGEQTAF
jgi:hypothetical protein